MILVTFALPAESSALRRKLRNVTRDEKVLLGSLPDQTSRVCLLHTGVGARECGKRLGVFLETNRPAVLVSSGLCGATNDDLAPGDLVIAQNYSEAQLTRTAKERLENAFVGKLFSADCVVDAAVDRYKIGREHGAMAIDMETHEIAHLCAQKKLPMLSLRVVSDSPAMPFPAPPQVLFDFEAQRTKFSCLLAHLAVEPAAVIRLARFSRQINTARQRLAEALCAVIPALSGECARPL